MCENCKTEEWKSIPGFSKYEVSNLGHVRSWSQRKHGGLLVPATSGDRYEFVFIIDNKGHYKKRRIHTLVLLAFIGKRRLGDHSRHLNGVRLDNRLCNLAYGTPTENGLDTQRYNGTLEKQIDRKQVKLLYINLRERAIQLYLDGRGTLRELGLLLGISASGMCLLVRGNRGHKCARPDKILQAQVGQFSGY